MVTSKSGHASRWGNRNTPNDKIFTPEPLAKDLLSMIPASKEDTWLDPFKGQGVFYNNMPPKKDWCEIDQGVDFFAVTKQFDWLVSNPPYSCLDEVLKQSTKLSKRGFGYLIGINNLTPRRIEYLEKEGFGLTKIHMCKVFHFYGMSLFCLWEKGKKSIIEYDRVVWK